LIAIGIIAAARILSTFRRIKAEERYAHSDYDNAAFASLAVEEFGARTAKRYYHSAAAPCSFRKCPCYAF